MPRSAPSSQILVLLGFLVVVESAGLLGLTLTFGELYRHQPRADYDVSLLGTGLFWMGLYALTAVAGWLVWRAPLGPPRRHALRWFVVQMLLPVVWTLAVFSLLAVGWGVALLALTAGAMFMAGVAAARVSVSAALLMVPALVATTYALVLNAELWNHDLIPTSFVR